MDLKDLASVSGKGGLYKVIKPARSGVILESLDEKKSKIIAGIHHQVSVLDEISIYTNDAEGSKPLKEVLLKIKEEFDNDTGIDNKTSPEELKSFLEYILPDYDRDRVYPSDIKKLVSWYHIIYDNFPEILEKDEGANSGKKANEDE